MKKGGRRGRKDRRCTLLPFDQGKRDRGDLLRRGKKRNVILEDAPVVEGEKKKKGETEIDSYPTGR